MIHTNFVAGGHKINRLRDSQLWQCDSPSYFAVDRLLTFDLRTLEPPPDWPQLPTKARVRFHIENIATQLDQVSSSSSGCVTFNLNSICRKHLLIKASIRRPVEGIATQLRQARSSAFACVNLMLTLTLLTTVCSTCPTELPCEGRLDQVSSQDSRSGWWQHCFVMHLLSMDADHLNLCRILTACPPKQGSKSRSRHNSAWP